MCQRGGKLNTKKKGGLLRVGDLEKEVIRTKFRKMLWGGTQNQTKKRKRAHKKNQNKPISFPPRPKLLLTQLQKRLPHKPAPHIKNPHRNLQRPSPPLPTLKHLSLLQALHHPPHSLRITNIAPDPHRFPPRCPNLGNDGFVIGGRASEKDDGVGGGEFEGEGAGGSRADAGDDAEGVGGWGGHCWCGGGGGGGGGDDGLGFGDVEVVG